MILPNPKYSVLPVLQQYDYKALVPGSTATFTRVSTGTRATTSK